MAALTPEQRAKLRADTAEACGPFLEDLRHLKRIVAISEHAAADIRHMSAILRRFLVERLIPILGAPRSGRIKIEEPDNKPVYKSAEGEPYLLFLSGGVTTHGTTFRALAVTRGKSRKKLAVGFDPDRVIEVPADNFLDQKVVCFDGNWANRRDVIKYVANVAHGVHSGKEENDVDKLIGRVRASAKLKAENGNVALTLDMDTMQGAVKPFAYDPNSIDPILLEILAAANYVVTSPDVLNLEAILAQELGLPPPHQP
jgi:hypothetical protein